MHWVKLCLLKGEVQCKSAKLVALVLCTFTVYSTCIEFACIEILFVS